MTKIVMVSYLNTIPFLKGLETDQNNLFEINKKTPSQCADVFQSGNANIALLPVATLPYLRQHKIITDYCIGCEGSVKTVVIASNSKIENVEVLYLDPDSRTSVQLAKILLDEHFGLKVKYVAGLPNLKSLKSNEAVLLIGDKVFDLEDEFLYVVDLGESWKKMTNLPFTFAVWVADDTVDEKTISSLNSMLKTGIESIPDTNFQSNSPIDLDTYFSTYISYEFNQPKREALSLFLDRIAKNVLL